MRKRHARAMNVADVNMTPMLDIVFILLIFFIVTSTYLREEAIGLEAAPTGTGSDAVQSILINLAADGTISVNGRYTDIGSVRANIERVKAENPETALVIQASPKARSGALLLIRDAAYNAGFKDKVNVTVSDDI